jgi:hypothetical protein
MNVRQIKIALTVDLINRPGSKSPLLMVQQAMAKFKDEAGKFTGLLPKAKSQINYGFEKQTFALLYENCTLDVDLVTDQKTKNQFVQSFHLTANFP